MSGASEIVGQLLVLVVLAVGGGCWLWILTGRPALERGSAWLWLALAGLALGTLLLQSLVYCGVPLRISTWPLLVVAVVGGWRAIKEWKRFRLTSRTGLRRELGAGCIVFVLALVGQAPPLLQQGPARFYGTGSYDQGNYVATADLFVEVPLDVGVETVGYRPWLAPILEAKEARITQSVLLGAVAVATRTSSQEAYGATNLFLIAVAGLATMGCLRVASIPRWYAACAGLAAALSPALTRVHLEGYFSQTASLFVLPALAGILGAKGPPRREMKVCTAILLAYLTSVYSEIALFGFALATVLLGWKAAPLRMRIRWLAEIFAGVLLLNPGYWGRLAAFLIEQWHGANGLDYSSRFPDAGTFAGWGRHFFAASGDTAAMLAGVGWGLLMVVGGCWLLRVRRMAPLMPLLLVLGAFGILCLKSPFPGYIFAKLSIQFAPLGIAVAICGLLALTPWAHWRGRWLRGLALLAVPLCWWGAEPWRRQVMEPTGVAAQLSSPRLVVVRQDVEAHPERSYLVACDDPVLAQWLCYFGRKSAVVVERRTVGDRILPTETYACRRWLGPPENLFWLDPERSGPVIGYEPAPALSVEGSQETGDEEGGGHFYVVGNALELVLRRDAGEAARPVWLDFTLIPWAGTQGCELELTDQAGRRWHMNVQGPAWCRWPVTVPPGSTHLRLSLRSNASVKGDPIALIKRFSVETAATLPPWQRITVATPLR